MMIKVDDPRVVAGWWTYHCCHQDIFQVDDETLAQIRADEHEVGPEWYLCSEDRNELLEKIAVDWEGSGYPEDAAHARALKDLK